MRPKNEGGLGVKSIETQNHCLLMKFIHKLHSAKPMPWKTWFFNELRGDLGDGHTDSTFLGCIVMEELNRYRAVTRVCLRNGQLCSFWFDDWHSKGPLFMAFPALFTHTTRAHASVHSVLSGPSPSLYLRPRLSRIASQEHSNLLVLLAGMQLDGTRPTVHDRLDQERIQFIGCIPCFPPHRPRGPQLQYCLEHRCAREGQIICLAFGSQQDQYESQPAPQEDHTAESCQLRVLQHGAGNSLAPICQLPCCYRYMAAPNHQLHRRCG